MNNNIINNDKNNNKFNQKKKSINEQQIIIEWYVVNRLNSLLLFIERTQAQLIYLFRRCILFIEKFKYKPCCAHIESE